MQSMIQWYSIFANFAISVSQCFAKPEFRKSCIASLAKTSFASFHKNFFFWQLYVCFARFVRLRKYECCKVSHFSVSQEFANRLFVSQVSKGSSFRNNWLSRLPKVPSHLPLYHEDQLLGSAPLVVTPNHTQFPPRNRTRKPKVLVGVLPSLR